MSDEKKFDWFEYYKLAKSYNNEKNAAKLRTGIGRFIIFRIKRLHFKKQHIFE